MTRYEIGAPILNDSGKWYPVIMRREVIREEPAPFGHVTYSGMEVVEALVEYFQTREECEQWIREQSDERSITEVS